MTTGMTIIGTDTIIKIIKIGVAIPVILTGATNQGRVGPTKMTLDAVTTIVGVTATSTKTTVVNNKKAGLISGFFVISVFTAGVLFLVLQRT